MTSSSLTINQTGQDPRRKILRFKTSDVLANAEQKAQDYVVTPVNNTFEKLRGSGNNPIRERVIDVLGWLTGFGGNPKAGDDWGAYVHGHQDLEEGRSTKQAVKTQEANYNISVVQEAVQAGKMTEEQVFSSTSPLNSFEKNVLKGMTNNTGPLPYFEQLFAFGFAPVVAAGIGNLFGNNPLGILGSGIIDSSAGLLMARQTWSSPNASPLLKACAVVSHGLGPLSNTIGEAFGYDKAGNSNFLGTITKGFGMLSMLGNFSVARTFEENHVQNEKAILASIEAGHLDKHDPVTKADLMYQRAGKWVNRVPARVSLFVMPIMMLSQFFMERIFNSQLKKKLENHKIAIQEKQQRIMQALSKEYQLLKSQGKSDEMAAKILRPKLEEAESFIEAYAKEQETEFEAEQKQVMGWWPEIAKYSGVLLNLSYIAMTGYMFSQLGYRALKEGLKIKKAHNNIAGNKKMNIVQAVWKGAGEISNGSVIPGLSLLAKEGAKPNTFTKNLNRCLAFIQPLVGISAMGGQALSIVNQTPLGQMGVFTSLTAAQENLKRIPGMEVASNLLMLAG